MKSLQNKIIILMKANLNQSFSDAPITHILLIIYSFIKWMANSMIFELLSTKCIASFNYSSNRFKD